MKTAIVAACAAVLSAPAMAFVSRPVALSGASQMQRATYSRSSLSMVKAGDAAPDFALKDQSGKIVKLSQFKGKKKVVLYFYPKDDTPGCSKQACAFNNNLKDFQKLGAEVIGISKDGDHTAFVQKFGLGFTLVSDDGGAVRKQYKVPSSLFGALDGRVTYIIGKDGIVKEVYDNQFSPESHIDVAKKALATA